MAPGLVYDNKSKSKPPQGALQAVQTSDIIIQSLQIPNQILHVKLGLQMQIPCLPFFLLFITFIPTFPASFGQKDVNLFQNCSSSLRCGESFPEIRFPFWGGKRSPECGMEGFYVTCLHDGLLTIDISGHTFRVHSINSTSYALTIAPDALWNGGCPEFYTDISPFFPAGQETTDLPLFYNCSYRINDDPKYRFSCSNTRDNNPRVYSFRNDSDCKENISVRALRSEVDKLNRGNASATLEDVLYKGFSVEYSLNWTACLGCMFSKGLCWAGTISAERTCLCSDGSRNLSDCPPAKKDKNIPLKIGIGFGASLGTALVAALLFFVYKRRQTKRSNSSSTLLSGDYSSYSSSALDPEKCMSNFGVHIFDYYELEEATSNFNSERELGDGGFGTVYKGKLKDGRDVAVKRLYENNFKRVDHFKNEVVILTRLRHKNLVTLYGCTSRHSRELLLVYEYVPNGTVADHLHGALAKPGSLPWSTRMKIAVETASALCYLHASDVIHRDVKTNNILLDSNFSVKVADFGLSRLFPMHMTHISTAPQGTPGYVDPEYHQCYQLTDRSDVFSFGVVLIELITSMPAVDITRHRHEINLSNLAINKIQSKTLHEIVDPNLGFETDENVRLMILDVAELAFQSLQQGRDMRPSMQEVLETLKHIQSKDANSGDASELDNQADEAKLLKSRTVTCSPDSVIEGWASSTTTPSISN